MSKSFSAYKDTARSRQATGTVPASVEDNSSLEKAAPKQKNTGRFSTAILRGSSGIKKRCCRPCKASGGHREPIPENSITLRTDGFKPTHDGMDIDGKKISPNKYFRIYRFPEFWKYPSEKRFMHIHGYSAENPTRQIIDPSNHQTMKTSDQQTSGSWDISICNQEGRCRQIRSYDASCLLSVLHLQVLVVDCDYPQWSTHPRIGYQIYWILF